MKRQEIHDNGGRPFLVDVYNDHVIVHQQDYNFDTDSFEPPKQILKRNFEKIFIGNKPKWQNPDNWKPSFVGNTILVKLKGGKFLYIGPSIQEFKPEKGDVIEEFFSEVGNNDVPYPQAIGKTHVYFFTGNQESISSMPIEYFNINEDLYKQFWLDHWINDCKYQRRMKGTDLCKRWKKKDPELKEQLDYLIANRKELKTKVLVKRDW